MVGVGGGGGRRLEVTEGRVMLQVYCDQVIASFICNFYFSVEAYTAVYENLLLKYLGMLLGC